MSIDELIAALDPQHRAIVLLASETAEFKKFPRAMGITSVNACRNRFKLIECEDAERAIWRYRLTDLGKRVKANLFQDKLED